MTTEFVIIYCTTSTREEANKLAEILLQKHLAACVNMFDKVRSVFLWDGKISKETEVLMGIKTKKSLFEKVKTELENNHSYEVPEIVSVPIEQGNEKYLDWLEDETL